MNRKKIIFIVAAVILFFSIIAVILLTRRHASPSADTESAPATSTIAGYDITGKWYADREDGGELTLHTDGTYQSTCWADEGTYSIEGYYVILIDSLGKRQQLYFSPENGSPRLSYTVQDKGFSFWRSADEAAASRKKLTEEKAEIQSFYDAALKQILLTEDWISDSGDAVLHFDQSSFTVTYSADNTETKTLSFGYEITDVTAKDGTYYVSFLRDYEGAITKSQMTILTTYSDDKQTYIISSQGFAFAYRYSKTVNITFLQPDSLDAN